MKLLILSDLNSIHTKKWIKAISSRGIEVVGFGLSKPSDDFYIGLENVEVHFSDFGGFI